MEHNSGAYRAMEQALFDLGFNDQARSLYMASLRLGPLPIAKLAAHLRITRPNVYKTIYVLEEKGLAHFRVRKGRIRTFMVEPPSVVLDLLKQKQRELLSIHASLGGMLPYFLSHYTQGNLSPAIEVYEGKQKFLQLFFKMLEEEKKEMLTFGSPEDFVDCITWDVEKTFIKKRVEWGIRMRALFLPSALAKQFRKDDLKELRETRVLEVKQPFITSFQIFGNRVAFWHPRAYLAIVIRDTYLVQMMRSIFEALWRASFPVK